MLQRDPHEAGALGQVDSLPAVLHVKALLHATWAHQRAVAPLQHSVHDTGTGGPPAEPPPQVPHHRAVEALHADAMDHSARMAPRAGAAYLSKEI